MQSESAVVSITFRPRSIACKWVSSGISFASGFVARIAVEDALDPVLRHQDRLGADLERAQRGGGVGREVRVARAGREDHDRGPSRGGARRGAGCTARRPPAPRSPTGRACRRRSARAPPARRARSAPSRACPCSRRSPGRCPAPPPPCRGRCCRRRSRARSRARPTRTSTSSQRELVDGVGVEAVLAASPSGPRRRASAGRA